MEEEGRDVEKKSGRQGCGTGDTRKLSQLCLMSWQSSDFCCETRPKADCLQERRQRGDWASSVY